MTTLPSNYIQPKAAGFNFSKRNDQIGLANPPMLCFTNQNALTDLVGCGGQDGPLEKVITSCNEMGVACQGVKMKSTGVCANAFKEIGGGTQNINNAKIIEHKKLPCWTVGQSVISGQVSKYQNCGGDCAAKVLKHITLLKPEPKNSVQHEYVDADKLYQKEYPIGVRLWNNAPDCFKPSDTGGESYVPSPGCPQDDEEKEKALARCTSMGAACMGVTCADGDVGQKCTVQQTLQFYGSTNGKSACGGKEPPCPKKSPSLHKSYVKQTGLWCLASITKIPKVVNGNIEHIEIKNLKVGDIVQTTRGNMPISDIMKTATRGYIHNNYVKVEKGALGENLPSEDLYVTHEHSFSLGYYNNSLLNRNIHDSEQDNMVYLHITADQLADKLPGVTRVSKEFESAINLVFDEHTSINIYGLDVIMHHPKGNPYILPEEKYQDKSKFNIKIQKPLFASYDMLVNAKPKHMEMKDFLRGCITSDLNKKFSMKDINNISFSPQKTMLTDDLRQKLKVV